MLLDELLAQIHFADQDVNPASAHGHSNQTEITHAVSNSANTDRRPPDEAIVAATGSGALGGACGPTTPSPCQASARDDHHVEERELLRPQQEPTVRLDGREIELDHGQAVRNVDEHVQDVPDDEHGESDFKQNEPHRVQKEGIKQSEWVDSDGEDELLVDEDDESRDELDATEDEDGTREAEESNIPSTVTSLE